MDQLLYRSNNKVVIPSLLPNMTPSTNQPLDSKYIEFQRIYSFQFLPLGFCLKIIASFSDFTCDTLWRNGIIITKQGEKARIVYDEDKKQLHVTVHIDKQLSLLRKGT